MFLCISLLLIPFAWLIGIMDKIRILKKPNVRIEEKLENSVAFIFFGPFILFANAMTDVFYFWKNNFRKDLQKIIITE